ncbi:MAG: hypothetical protein M3R59_06355 [Verrucomicrobiota bacterium]|nr:hypothetical protein [Verrucomicrobiota bacterium]
MRPFAVCVCFAAMVLCDRIVPKEPDHLYPVDVSRFPVYRALLRKLEKTPFDCGRILDLTDFSDEWSISIYHQAFSAIPGAYFVAYIKAENTLWGASGGGRFARGGQNVAVQRIDLTIPEKTANLLRQAFDIMLRETRALGHDERPRVMIGEGGSRQEFSLELGRGHVVRGAIGDFAPAGPKLRTFQQLSANLHAYCEGKIDHLRLLQKIENDAAKIIGEE